MSQTPEILAVTAGDYVEILDGDIVPLDAFVEGLTPTQARAFADELRAAADAVERPQRRSAPRSERYGTVDHESVAEQVVENAWTHWEAASATCPGPLLIVLRDAVWALEDAIDTGLDVGGPVVRVAQAVTVVSRFESDDVSAGVA